MGKTSDPAPPASTRTTVKRSTAQGAQGIFKRFVLVVLAVNFLTGVVVLIYDIADSYAYTRENLKMTGELAIKLCDELRRTRRDLSDEKVVEQAATLTGLPMALLGPRDEVLFTTDVAISSTLPQVFTDDKRFGIEVEIDEDLGALSGAWMVHNFVRGKRLVTIVPRLPQEEGLIRYATIGAGVLVLGMLITVLAILGSANWMLRQPLSRLVSQLTGALARDVERRRRAERVAVAAREDAEGHLSFLDNLIDAAQQLGIVATDEDGRIQIMNRTAEAVLGLAADDTVDHLAMSELWKRVRGRPPRQEIQLRSLMSLGENEEFIVDGEGVERLLRIQRSDIVDAEGQTKGQLTIFADITERRQMRVELQLNELQLIQSAKLASVGEMATGVAHELNQPLNNIGLLASRMSKRVAVTEDQDGPFLREKLQKVQSQVARAGKIIDQLRNFGRPRPKTLTSFSVERPINNVLDLLGEQFRRRGIEIDVDVSDDLLNVEADEVQLEQVLINLLNNARDVLTGPLPEGRQPKLSVSVDMQTLSTSSPQLCIHVRDNGPGMDEEIAERIFEPFFTTKEVGKGTGLGLSISYGLVRDFGGKLVVRSTPGKGTTFIVFLKLASTPAKVIRDKLNS